MIYIKINNQWNLVSTVFVKENGEWVEYSGDTGSLISSSYCSFGGVILPKLRITGPDSASSETITFSLLYEEQQVSENIVWSILSGSQYATISQNGTLAILNGAENGIVTISAEYADSTANKTVCVTYASGSSIVVNEDGTATETVTTDDGQGNVTVNETTTNENGDIVQESVKETYSDGSSHEVETIYNSDGTQTQNTADTDTSGNTQTQIKSIDGNGNEEITGYVIDTSENENGGLAADGGIETGVIAFNGKPFTIHMKIKFNSNENAGRYLVTAIERLESGRYAGFGFQVYDANTVWGYATTSSTIGNSSFGSRMTMYEDQTTSGSSSQIRYMKTGRTEYTVDITYRPTTTEDGATEYKQISFHIEPIYSSASGSATVTKTFWTYSRGNANIPDSLPNATITVGSLGVNNNKDMVNLEIIEFSVLK